MKNIVGILGTTLALTLTLSSAGHRSHTSHLARTRTSLATGMVGEPYSQKLQENGGTGPYTWSVAAGTKLPAGLSLDPESGLISGVPQVAGVVSVTSHVRDSSMPAHSATQSYLLKIGPRPFDFPSTLLASAQVHHPYAQKLSVDGGMPPYTWKVASGRLPDGIHLDPRTGVLTGRPLGAADTEFTIEVQDSSADREMGWQRALAWGKGVLHPADEGATN